MKYIIMCGGQYRGFDVPRWLTPVGNETLVERTIRLLKESGVTDIAISSNFDYFDNLGVPVLKHDNQYRCGDPTSKHTWMWAFYPTDEPVCYIFGDVLFSPKAIKKIVETETDDIEFFASAPPFAPNYSRTYAEPFAFKVVNQKHFHQAVEDTRMYYHMGKLRRCIAWELWQVIKGTPLNHINYKNYTAINDYTCDIDHPRDVSRIKWQNT